MYSISGIEKFRLITEDKNMAYYNIVTQSNESTVVAEYTASSVRSDAYQSEADLEREFIALLKTQGYEYLPIHTEADLIINLRKQLEALNGIQFTDSEWKRFFSVHIANANESIVEKRGNCKKATAVSISSEMTG